MNVVMVIYTIGRIRQPRTVAIVVLAWEKYRITIVFCFRIANNKLRGQT